MENNYYKEFFWADVHYHELDVNLEWIKKLSKDKISQFLIEIQFLWHYALWRVFGNVVTLW